MVPPQKVSCHTFLMATCHGHFPGLDSLPPRKKLLILIFSSTQVFVLLNVVFYGPPLLDLQNMVALWPICLALGSRVGIKRIKGWTRFVKETRCFEIRRTKWQFIQWLEWQVPFDGFEMVILEWQVWNDRFGITDSEPQIWNDRFVMTDSEQWVQNDRFGMIG